MIASGAVAQSAEQPFGALDVGVERVERRGERCLRIALRGEMEDVVGLRRLHAILHRHRVAQVRVVELDPTPCVDASRWSEMLTSGLRQRSIPWISQSVFSSR